MPPTLVLGLAASAGSFAALVGTAIVGAADGAAEYAIPGFLATLGVAIASVIRTFGRMVRNGDIVFANAAKRDEALTALIEDTNVLMASLAKRIDEIVAVGQRAFEREDSYRELITTYDIVRVLQSDERVERRHIDRPNAPKRRSTDK